MQSKTCLMLLVLLFAGDPHAVPLGTAFTYQGELKQLGAPANGPFDFQFEIFDIDADGVTIANTVLLDGVDVADGVFTVQLDFGSVPFAGDRHVSAVDIAEVVIDQ